VRTFTGAVVRYFGFIDQLADRCQASKGAISLTEAAAFIGDVRESFCHYCMDVFNCPFCIDVFEVECSCGFEQLNERLLVDNDKSFEES